jgi:hypothetical protein
MVIELVQVLKYYSLDTAFPRTVYSCMATTYIFSEIPRPTQKLLIVGNTNFFSSNCRTMFASNVAKIG